MGHVFISYSKKDSDYAQSLAQALRDEGFEVWIDNRIESGSDWWKSIMEALRTCSAFIVIMSNNSEKSDYVQRELTIADGLKKPAFPLLLEGDNNLLSSDLWAIYVRTQYEDVRQRTMPSKAFYQRVAEKMQQENRILKDEAKSITGLMPAVPEAERGIGLDMDGLPEIDWLHIPEGRFIYGDSAVAETLSLASFYISRYPITYLQYQAFVEDGGYKNPDYWTIPAWQWKERGKVSSLPDWKNPDWHVDNHPVVFVTWFEAMAFCAWLSHKRQAQISLPTEKQWEKAARGEHGLLYPWGNTYLSGLANINEGYHSNFREDPASLRWAKSVTDAQHQSPFGLRDVCGNTWEWCKSGETDADTDAVLPSTEQALRGGSWYFNQQFATTVYALKQPANARRYEAGFRMIMKA